MEIIPKPFASKTRSDFNTMYIIILIKYNRRHLIKLYDSMAQLKFSKEKIAVGMYAKDGEYVEFSEHCECSGQVNFKYKL